MKKKKNTSYKKALSTKKTTNKKVKIKVKKYKVKQAEKKPLPIITQLTNAIKKPTSTKSTGNYLSKSELLKAVMESKGIGRMSDDLAMKLQLLTSKYARSAQFARYTFNDDMQAYAMMMLVRTWHSFNPEKSDNPFAFFTQCIKNSFIQFLNHEKRQRNIRDELLVDQGLNPSYTYLSEHEGERYILQEEKDQTKESGTRSEGGEESSEY